MDSVMGEYFRLSGDAEARQLHAKRVEKARLQGAEAFMPNQFTK
jgi:hypothetical protein